MKHEAEELKKKLESTVRHYNFLLNQKDKMYNARLAEIENLFMSSWKWKVGNFIVLAFIQSVNFLRNPVRFFREPASRAMWNGYDSRLTGITYSEAGLPDADIPPVPPAAHVKETPAKEVPSPVKPAIPEKKTEGPPPIVSADLRPLLAAILGDEIREYLEPDFRIPMFRPDNWAALFEGNKPEALLVESATTGNRGAWRHRVAGEVSAFGSELEEMVKWAGANSVPSLFLLNSHPNLAMDFAPRAGLFQHILVSDTGNMDRYYKEFGMERTKPFPTAVNPVRFNPIGPAAEKRELFFRFDGFQGDHADARWVAENLLPPSWRRSLKIVDSRAGDPEYLNPLVAVDAGFGSCFTRKRPSESVAGYYRDSLATIFYRWANDADSRIPLAVLESLACGTPVICNREDFMLKTFGEVILFSDSARETEEHLDRLESGRFFRNKLVVNGLRFILDNYDIREQLNTLNQPGLRICPLKKLPDICILLNHCEREEMKVLAYQILSQTCRPGAVAVLSEAEMVSEEIEWFAKECGVANVFNVTHYQNQMSGQIIAKSGCSFFAVFDVGSKYGPGYLHDYARATRFGMAKAFGKGNPFTITGGTVSSTLPGLKDFTFIPSVPLASLMISGEWLGSLNFNALMEPGACFETFEPAILSTDRFNFISSGSGSRIADDLPNRELFI